MASFLANENGLEACIEQFVRKAYRYAYFQSIIVAVMHIYYAYILLICVHVVFCKQPSCLAWSFLYKKRVWQPKFSFNRSSETLFSRGMHIPKNSIRMLKTKLNEINNDLQNDVFTFHCSRSQGS